jgi:hypothetical protein
MITQRAAHPILYVYLPVVVLLLLCRHAAPAKEWMRSLMVYDDEKEAAYQDLSAEDMSETGTAARLVKHEPSRVAFLQNRFLY